MPNPNVTSPVFFAPPCIYIYTGLFRNGTRRYGIPANKPNNV